VRSEVISLQALPERYRHDSCQLRGICRGIFALPMDITRGGLHFGPPGYETNLLYLAALATLVLGGSGPFALGAWLQSPQERTGEDSMTPVAAVDRLFEAHLIVANLDASIAFYRDRVGLELAHVIPARQAAFFWIGSRGNSMLGLWQAGAGPQKTTTHIAFAAAADDVIAAPGRLQSAGIVAVDFDGQPTDEPVVLAWMPALAVYFLDPDGHLLEYIAMLEGEPRPDEGVVAWRSWTH
jgi:lactoylglutathione lyase